MKRGSNVKINYLYNLSYQILAIITPLITTPYVARILDANGIGQYNYTQSITYLFIMFVILGTRSYAVREIAYCREDIKKRSIIFFEILEVKIVTFVLFSLAYFLFMSFYNQYRILFFILFLQMIAALLDISWFFQGLEDFKKTVIRNCIVKITGIILILTCVKTADDLPIYALILCGTELLGNISMWVYLPKIIKKVPLIELFPKRHVKSVIILFLPSMATYVYTSLDKVMLGILSNTEQVGFYSQSERLIRLLVTILTSLGIVLVPRMANLMKKGNWKEVKKYFTKSIQFIFMVSMPMSFGLISVSDQFIPWFLGKDFFASVSLLNILTPLILILGISGISGQAVLVSMGKHKYYTYTVIVGACVNLALNFLLIPNLQAKGAVIATVLAEGVVTILQLVGARKIVDLKKILRLTYKYVIGALIMFGVLMEVKSIFNNMFIQITFGISVYSIFLLLVKDVLIYEVLNKLIWKLKKQ